MKSRILPVVLVLCIILSSYPMSVGRAMSTATASQPSDLSVVSPDDLSPPAPGENVPEEIANVPGATEDWWSGVLDRVRAEMYTLASDTSEGGEPVHRGHSPAHGFDLAFAAGGVQLTVSRLRQAPASDPGLNGVLAANTQPETAAMGQWTWGLTLTGYGTPNRIRRVTEPQEVLAESNRLTYQRASLDEWYVNDDRGLEQGFTLHAPPAGGSNDTLVLEMALTTDLEAMLTDEGQAVAFVVPGGNVVVLRYADLYVVDAAGSELPAHFALGQGTISIEIDAAGAVYPITVDPLATTTPTWTGQGEDTSFGQTVGTAGDVNGDGFDDIVVGAWSYTNLSAAGKAFVYHGSASGLGLIPAWEVDGENDGDSFGKAAGTAGDVNGDGYDDIIVGAYAHNGSTGKAYVYLGSPTGLSTTAAWTRTGEGTGHWYGHAVGTTGDVNGDGFDDVIVSAPKHGDSAGKVYVYGGSATGLSTSPVWTAVGVRDWPRYDYWGWDAGTAGDVNGDGYDDVIVGGYLHDLYRGKVGIYFGSATGLSAETDWTATGENQDDRFGYAAGTAGDVNGDGYDDIIVGAYAHSGSTGKVYVYLGTGAGPLSAPSWSATGENTGDAFGISVSAAGDSYGGDGYDDILIGAPDYDSDKGKVYVYGGTEDGPSATPVWTVAPEAIVEYMGRDVGLAGDVNGDGFDDLAVGAPWRARCYVYNGSASGPSGAPAWSGAGEATGDRYGYAVGAAGDVNSDGYADVVVGAPGFGGDIGKAYVFQGSPQGLVSVPLWTGEGVDAGALFGGAVATAGDVNDDGFDDLIVGAPGVDRARGEAYIYFGSWAGLSDAPDWQSGGENAGDRFGRAVAAAGDVNGDGVADLAIGAYSYPSGSSYGRVYVYHGSDLGPGSGPSWTFVGESVGDRFGYALGTAGDVNGDGYDDLVVGAYGYDNAAGKAYVFHGSETGLAAEAAWTDIQYSDDRRFGISVSTAGDVNGDGYADVIIGTLGYDDGGSVNACPSYLYYGSVDGLSDSSDLRLKPRYADTYFGTAVGTAGDVNGDGYADVILGAYGDNGFTGHVYVFLGSATGLEGEYSYAAAWDAGGETAGDRFGAAVATAGDINGDGFSDLIVGAYAADHNTGEAYLYYGAPEGLAEAAAFTATGTDTWTFFGEAVGLAGDVNGDGYADVYVGVPSYPSWGSPGGVYVYYGSPTGLGATPDWIGVGVGRGDYFGSSVDAAGDVNGDGYGDLIVGAYRRPNWGDRGSAYLFLGSASGLRQTPVWSPEGEHDGDRFGQVVGGAGDVNGDGFSDVVVSAPSYNGGMGKIYAYLGTTTGLGAAAAWSVAGDRASQSLGSAVATAGDVNGDGYADLVVGDYAYQSYTGKVIVYHGSSSGLGETPAWSDTGENYQDRLGCSVSTAGDVNGDGFADVVIGADGYDSYSGKAVIYHGSSLGLGAPNTEILGVGADPHFGDTVSTAGDVNGDGYTDVIIGTYGYPSANYTGTVHLYQGSAVGVTPAVAWIATGEGADSRFGWSSGTAGDVNGDGFSDVIVGAAGHYTNTGRVYLYNGSDGGGRVALSRQMRGDDSGRPVQPWGVSYAEDGFAVSLTVVHPFGRGSARLQVEACPAGVSFGADGCVVRTSDSRREIDDADGVELTETVAGLDANVVYRWRARALYDTPILRQGPWRELLGRADIADVRVLELPTDLNIAKHVTPSDPVVGQPITYTLTYAALGGPAADVEITDILPDDISSVQVTSSGPPISDTGVTPGYVWHIGNLDSGEGGVITITGIAESTRFFNTASITTTSPDLNPDNNVAAVQTHIAGIIFVDQAAPGPLHDGQSWATAYTELRDALAVAQAGDEIWVAAGTYTPSDAADRSASFNLVNDLTIYGGFAGTEVWPYQRDWTQNLTVLSGDIGTLNNDEDNAYHVISATGVTSATLLDGFTVMGGNADGTGADAKGGGLYNDGSALRIQNVVFAGNYAADQGGAVMNMNGGTLSFLQVAFTGNEAGNSGGALNLAYPGSATLTNVTFSANTAGTYGGAINCEMGAAADVANSILWGNTPDQIRQAWMYQVDVHHSDVEGSWLGTANLQVDPHFYDADGVDDVPGTLDDDLRLRHDSPVIDQGDNDAVPLDADDADGDGVTTEPLPLDFSRRSRLIGFTVVDPVVDMGLYEANILDVIAEADALLDDGLQFRLSQVQLLPADTMAQALQNYKDFNDGDLFYDFCADYEQIDDEGYCPDDVDRLNVRNELLDAVGLYAVAINWPTEAWTSHTGETISVRQIGGTGVVSAAHEIANVHLIFGNEFLIDAIDYRFSLEGIPYADEIIAQELDELGEAKRQFELTVDLIFRVFDNCQFDAGQYCSVDQFETFGVASSRMMTTLDEMASRYRMLGDEQAALSIYDKAYEEQYLQLTTLTQMAHRTGAQYLQNGSWEMFNSLSRMRDRAQAIRDGLDFFGFAPDYVPLQSYEHLMELTEGPTGDTGLLGTARDLEDQAREAQRTYDANATSLANELRSLEKEYNAKLRDLCGLSEDLNGDGLPDYNPCEGGLMGRNLYDLDAASLKVGLAWMKAQGYVERIQAEQERTARTIEIKLGLAQEVSAITLAIAKLNAYKETYTQLGSAEHKITAGIKASTNVYAQTEVKGSINPLASSAEIKSGLKVSLDTYVGYEASGRWVSSAAIAWTPNVEEIGTWNSIKTLKDAEAQAEILNANSAATIKNLLLQQSQALIEYEIAMVAFNKLAAEHNQLAGKVSWYLNKREQAANKVAKRNSHLLSPAYRIMRDTLTLQSAESLSLAAQFAYLTARAAEYELLTPYPDLDAIYRARTSNDIRLFLDALNVWYQALDLPGQLNRYPYTISYAEDVLGLTAENLDPDGRLPQEDVDQMRFERFQDYLQDQVDDEGKLELWFSTSLDQQRDGGQFLFSPNIWNNRIAGIGAPLAQNEGVSLNIVTKQTSEVGSPEVVLIHDGQTSYRTAAEEIVYYDPDTAVPVGYLLPDELDPESTSIVLRPGINGVGAIANSGLINRSVAASSWTLRVPADSRGYLDYAQIADFEILLDTSGRALPDMGTQAATDAANLQAGLALDPVSTARLSVPAAADAPSPAAVSILPANPDGIGGSYFGSVIVTDPLTSAVQVLNFDLVNVDGMLTGTLNIAETALYDGEVTLHGIAVGDAFTLTSAVIENTVLGKSVDRVITLAGTAARNGEILKATYTSVINDLLCTPVTESGMFSASRPGSPGSPSLTLDVGAESLPLAGTTVVTVTLRDSAMQPVSGTTYVELTTDLGVVTPLTLDADGGTAVATFAAGDVPGKATIWATTGEITDTARIQIESTQIEEVHRAYLPLVALNAGGPARAPDLVVDEVNAASSSIQITIRNAGDAPVADSFWVDAYIDPDPAPFYPNQIWNDVADQGLVWGVNVALQPGESLVLAVDDTFYRPQISQISWPLLAGTPVYVQVDSWNFDTMYGAIREGHEIAGEAYDNNIGFARVRREDIRLQTVTPAVLLDDALPPRVPQGENMR